MGGCADSVGVVIGSSSWLKRVFRRDVSLVVWTSAEGQSGGHGGGWWVRSNQDAISKFNISCVNWHKPEIVPDIEAAGRAGGPLGSRRRLRAIAVGVGSVGVPASHRDVRGRDIREPGQVVL